MSTGEARERLASLARELRALAAEMERSGLQGLTLTAWAANAFESYLDEKEKSLDHAFGVVRPKHRPTNDPAIRRQHAKTAHEADRLRKQNVPWDEIGERLNRDEKTVRKIHEAWQPKLMARKVIKHLSAADERERLERIAAAKKAARIARRTSGR